MTTAYKHIIRDETNIRETCAKDNKEFGNGIALVHIPLNIFKDSICYQYSFLYELYLNDIVRYRISFKHFLT